jgi:hypothetical protein
MAIEGGKAGEEDDEKSVRRKVHRLHASNQLTEDVLGDYLAMREHEFVIIALSIKVNAKTETVRKIFKLQKPKLVCAVCWRAGLSMRFALRLQQEMAQIPPRELIYPKDGTDYPLTAEEMEWQLEFIGV